MERLFDIMFWCFSLKIDTKARFIILIQDKKLIAK